MKDAPQDFVEFTHPGGNLLAKVVVPSVGQNEAPVIREQIVARLGEATKGKALILDLSQVSLVSSLGLGTLVDLRAAAEKAGLRPVAHGLNKHLVELFALMRIERLFTITKSQQELDQVLSH